MGGIVKRDAGIRIGKRLVHVFAMLPPAGGRALLTAPHIIIWRNLFDRDRHKVLIGTDGRAGRIREAFGQQAPRCGVISFD